jgi:hypothetical protein
LFLQIVLAVDGLAHIEAAEEIVILAGHGAELRIGGQILQIGLDHRRAVREHLDQPVFALDEQVHNLVHRGRSGHGRGWLRHGLRRRGYGLRSLRGRGCADAGRLLRRSAVCVASGADGCADGL